MALAQELATLYHDRDTSVQRELLNEKASEILLDMVKRDALTLKLVASRYPGITLLRFHRHDRILMRYMKNGIFWSYVRPRNKESIAWNSVRCLNTLTSPHFIQGLAKYVDEFLGKGEDNNIMIFISADPLDPRFLLLRMTWDGVPPLDVVGALYPGE